MYGNTVVTAVTLAIGGNESRYPPFRTAHRAPPTRLPCSCDASLPPRLLRCAVPLGMAICMCCGAAGARFWEWGLFASPAVPRGVASPTPVSPDGAGGWCGCNAPVHRAEALGSASAVADANAPQGTKNGPNQSFLLQISFLPTVKSASGEGGCRGGGGSNPLLLRLSAVLIHPWGRVTTVSTATTHTHTHTHTRLKRDEQA